MDYHVIEWANAHYGYIIVGWREYIFHYHTSRIVFTGDQAACTRVLNHITCTTTSHQLGVSLMVIHTETH